MESNFPNSKKNPSKPIKSPRQQLTAQGCDTGTEVGASPAPPGHTTLPTLPACFCCQGDGGCWHSPALWCGGTGYLVELFFNFLIFFLIYRQPQARSRGVKLLRSSSLPIPTRCLTSRPVRLLQRVQGWGEGTQPPAPALPPTPMSSWAFCIQGSEEFGGVLLSSSRCPAGFAGRGGTDLCWGAWGESGWMGTALTSPGTLSSANTTGLGLCSKEGPGNICIKNKYTPPKHSPTLQEENEGGKKATIQRKKTTSNLTHLCCASV